MCLRNVYFAEEKMIFSLKGRAHLRNPSKQALFKCVQVVIISLRPDLPIRYNILVGKRLVT